MYAYMYLHNYSKILEKIQFQSTSFRLGMEAHVEKEASENFKMCLITPAVDRWKLVLTYWSFIRWGNYSVWMKLSRDADLNLV